LIGGIVLFIYGTLWASENAVTWQVIGIIIAEPRGVTLTFRELKKWGLPDVASYIAIVSELLLINTLVGGLVARGNLLK
jgi:hypothetical protein